MSATPPTGVSRLVPLVVPGPAGPLEALLQEWDSAPPSLAAIVCHPHPLYGGTLHNKVVHRVAATLHQLGAAVLRFNYRGVGKSAGAYDRAIGELEDARAALAFLRQRYPQARRWVAGFSFGSGIAARLGASEPEVERIILIAPPVKTTSFEVLYTCATPKLAVHGSADDVCHLEDLERDWPNWAEPKRLIVVPGASHFFDRQLSDLADALMEGLKSAAAGVAT